MSGTREKHAEILSNRGGEVAIGYQLELEKASRCGNCGQILKILARNKPAKYNRYVITDPVFKTTAIDHSAIPPAFASVHYWACFGVARQSAKGTTAAASKIRPEFARLHNTETNSPPPVTGSVTFETTRHTRGPTAFHCGVARRWAEPDHVPLYSLPQTALTADGDAMGTGTGDRARLVNDYSHRRSHESLQNVTPADVYFGRQAGSWRTENGSSSGRYDDGGGITNAGGLGHSLRSVS